jgi:hypothetical protein
MPVSLDQLLAEAEALRDKPWPLGEMIRYRHKLTSNIEFNLYGGGTKEEGRRALAVRNSLDEMISGATASDMIDGDLGGLEHLRKGIAMENIAEKLQILEDLSVSAKQPGMNMKRAMTNILTDADRFQRFAPDHQAIIKAAASGSRFLAERRFKRILTAIQQQAEALQAA